MSKFRGGGGGGGPGADLKRWCAKMTEGYPGVTIANFHTSWRDGLAFCALVHRHAPDALDFASLDPANIEANNQLAFDMAFKHFNVPKLLDAEDMLMAKPEQFSIMTYLLQFYKAVADKQKPLVPVSGLGSSSATSPRGSSSSGGCSSPRGPRPAAPLVATVRPAGTPSTVTAVPVSQMLRTAQTSPPGTPGTGSAASGRAKRVSLVIQPNQIAGLIQSQETTSPTGSAASGRARRVSLVVQPNQIAGLINSQAQQPATGSVNKTWPPQASTQQETGQFEKQAESKIGRRGTINLGTQELVPSFMRNQMPATPPVPERPAASFQLGAGRTAPAVPAREAPAPPTVAVEKAPEPEPELEDEEEDDEEIAMTQAVKTLINVYENQRDDKVKLEAAIKELDLAHQLFQRNGRGAAGTCLEEDKEILFPAFDGVTEIVDDLKKQIREGKPSVAELQMMCNDILVIINDEIMEVLLGGQFNMGEYDEDYEDDEDIDFSELDTTPVPDDIEYVSPEEMEDRYNEALDIVEELEEKLRETEEKLETTIQEFEEKTQSQEEQIKKLLQALKEKDEKIAQLSDDSKTAELQKKLDEAQAQLKKANRDKKDKTKLAADYKSKLDAITAIINK
eukprot:TRINITY_DN16724_c0_g1_i1.p1 TRINITY_DN16724_c0_g1~~TRINITY_DN16724_c0_g1_i1.p1  ORF type:complete len:622 (+),score=181.55 TRINITY_DN16724_c0_g1_i1:110-1975(+)